jgi:hypothetical protein
LTGKEEHQRAVSEAIRVSTRTRFREGDEDWEEFVDFIGLPSLTEVRSVDAHLNDYFEACGEIVGTVDEDGTCHEITPTTLHENIKCTPAPISDNEYIAMRNNLSGPYASFRPEGWRLLGYDLCDETHTSSLLNCGPWTGQLKPFTKRLNQYGLLSLEDAKAAQLLLPEEWGDCEPHAKVDVWALYELE